MFNITSKFLFSNNIMGQNIVTDPSRQLIATPTKINTRQSQNYTPLRICPSVFVPFHKIYSYNESQTHYELSIKFFHKNYIYLKITKKSQQRLNDGVFFPMGMMFVYGYKHKAKSADKIKRQSMLNKAPKIGEFLLFKKRIYAPPQEALLIFAQLKLFSQLQIGPFIGKMADNTDGHITSQYLEYFSEINLNIRNQIPSKIKQKTIEELLKKTIKDLQKKNFKVQDNNKLIELCFSPYQKSYLVKLIQFNKGKVSDESSLVTNTTSAFIKKQYDEQAQKMVAKIDKKTNMLSMLQNLIIQKNIDQAIDIFEQVMETIENKQQKHKYAFHFCDILSQTPYFQEYQQQVISELLSPKQILKETSSMLQSNSLYGQKLEDRFNKIKIKSLDWHSQNQLEQFSKSFSKDQSSRTFLKFQQLKINVQSNNKNRAKQIIAEMKKMSQGKQNQQVYLYQVQYQYGLMLMKTGKSRHALILFQMLNRNQSVPDYLKCTMYNYMGIIYYYKEKFALAVRQFEKSLGIMLKNYKYSSAMMTAFNNIGCSYYRQVSLDKAVQFFCRALSCGEISTDYQMMARSNKGMALIQRKMIKQAKNQFMMILKMIQPANNASIICKTYSNLGYLNMIQNNFNQALTDFQIANKIQSACLIPNGHKPSVFLHNNIAMVYHKKKQYRKSLAHIQKCKQQIQMLKGFDAVIVHFNYAMIYQKLYFYQIALKHLADCRKYLQRSKFGNYESKQPMMQQRHVYEKKIDNEIEKLNQMRIIQDSEQSGYQSLSSRYSAVKKYL